MDPAPIEEDVRSEEPPGDPPLVDADFQCPQGFADFGEPELVTGLALPGNVFGPVLSHDGRTLVFSSIAAEGDDEDIFLATRTEVGAAFGLAACARRSRLPSEPLSWSRR